jgi:hypothetical protein
MTTVAEVPEALFRFLTFPFLTFYGVYGNWLGACHCRSAVGRGFYASMCLFSVAMLIAWVVP